MGDNTEMGTLAVTEELHAKQQEAARKEAERAARKAPQDAAADAKGEAGEPASKKGSAARSSRPPGRPAIGGRACRAQAGRPGDGTRWDTGTRRRRPAARNALGTHVWSCLGGHRSTMAQIGRAGRAGRSGVFGSRRIRAGGRRLRRGHITASGALSLTFRRCLRQLKHRGDKTK